MASKTIFCIRHGESTFNALHRLTGVDPLHYDAPLSETGREQVESAAKELRDLPIDLVITSPLTRALQTVTGLFAEHRSAPTILVEALHRERVENSCDVGRRPADLARDFPAFSLGHLPDVWWHHQVEALDERGLSVEPIELLEIRVEQFKLFLARRSERSIAVVGHGTFFYHLLGRWLRNCEIAEFSLPDDQPAA